jgi:hypothetical protein
MNGTGDHNVEWDKLNSERQILHVFAHTQNIDLKDIAWLNCKRGSVLGGPARRGRGKGEECGE